ncbi:aspartate aminotransferase family protein [soil metagenome]
MTLTTLPTSDALRADADAHLWRHFAAHSGTDRTQLPVMIAGEGCYLIDTEGRRYLDGLSNLFCVNLGYSYGEEFGQAALAQYRQLGYHSSWGSTHPAAIELATRLAELAPGNLSHVFLTPSGGESVEAAWKIARQYHRLRGEHRWKAIGREMAFHGTTLGALSLNGITDIRTPFEPLLPGASHVANTRRLGRPEGESEDAFTAFLLDDLERRIRTEDPSTVAMVILEPVQSHGGALVPPAGYHAGVRALCDEYGILLVADETVTAFGRLGEWFGSTRYDVAPDIITTAKGLSSAHAVIGAVLVDEMVVAQFRTDGVMLRHGNTFGGHPVMAAVALRNLELMTELGINAHVSTKEAELTAKLATLRTLPIVADTRGAGYFHAVEMISTYPDGRPLSDADKSRLYGTELLGDPLVEHGVLLRVSLEGGDPILSVAPPLVADSAEFDQIVGALHTVLGRLGEHAGVA